MTRQALGSVGIAGSGEKLLAHREAERADDALIRAGTGRQATLDPHELRTTEARELRELRLRVLPRRAHTPHGLGERHSGQLTAPCRISGHFRWPW
jgi:hypothetical protein